MRPARARRSPAACESRPSAAEEGEVEEDAQEAEPERLWLRSRGRDRAQPASGGGGRGPGATVARAALVLVAAAFLLSAWPRLRRSPPDREVRRSFEGRGGPSIVVATEVGGPGGDEGALLAQRMHLAPPGEAGGAAGTRGVGSSPPAPVDASRPEKGPAPPGEAGSETTTTFTVTLTTITEASQTTQYEQPPMEARSEVASTDTTLTGTGPPTTTGTVFWDRLPPADFPEIMYLTVPESDTDAERMKQMKEEIVRYLPENRWGVRIIPGVVPELWPEGRYDRVFKYGHMLPKKLVPHKRIPEQAAPSGASRRENCTWAYKDKGGLYDHFYAAPPGADTEDACKEHCCHDLKCKAIRFSPSAVDGPDLQCLLYPRGLEAWSLERPLYEDYRVHLLDCADYADSPDEEEDVVEEEEEEGETPWWDTRNLNMARITSTGKHPVDPDAWPAHHCGCSLSHFSMWMEALDRGVQNLVVFESDGFPSCVQNWHVGGNASDFTDLITALPSRAPEGWDLIVLDKGEFGAQPDAPPVGVVRPASGGGSRSYTLIPWKGRGVAGAAAYMVSRRFLEWFPHDIQRHGFNMVDAWIGCRCSDANPFTNPSPINCYSILAEGHKAE